MEAHGGFPIRKLFFLIVLLLSFDLAYGQDIFGTDTKAFVIMPAEVVSSGITKDAEVSESGRWIIYQRQIISSAENLIAKKGSEEFVWFGYDRETKSNTKLSLPPDATRVVVMGDNQNLYFERRGMMTKPFFYNIKSGVITSAPSSEGYRLHYFGEKDFAPYLLYQKDTQAILVYPNGKQSSFNHDASLIIDHPIGSDAQNLYFIATVEKSRPTKIGRVSLNRQTGTTSFAEWNMEEVDKFVERERADQEDFDFEYQANATYISLSDETPPNKSIIPKSGKLCLTDDVSLNRQHGLAIFQDSGALLFREIKRIDIKLAVKGVEDILKEKTIREAKQIAIAFILLSADSDDIMPVQEGWLEKVLPYTKNRELLNRFSYTFKGGDVSTLDGSKVELGFIMGLGGRAVAYVDGSVKWIPNP